MTLLEEETTENRNANVMHVPPLALPSELEYRLKEPVKLIFQIIFLAIIFVPMLVWSFFEYILARRKSVKGSVVLITGSGRGLGQAFAEEFARLGCRVACVDIDHILNEETVRSIKLMYPSCGAKAYKCNVASANEVHAMKEAVTHDFGRVNMLVHNAAIVCPNDVIDIDDLVLNNIIDVNLKSHFLILREFLPDMIQRNEGHIVAVASLAAFNATPNMSLYVAAKHGVMGLMDCLHLELQKNPNNAVKTTIICPYFMNTSALYMKYSNSRLPVLSIEKAVEASVNGILKNRRIISIPAGLYCVSMFIKFLPDKLLYLIHKIFYVEITLPPKDIINNLPLYHHLSSYKKDA